MDLAVEKSVNERVNAGVMSGRALLSTFRMLDEASRLTPAYSDPRYAPFYYILGQERPAKYLLEFGFGIGIASGCYVRGCKTVEKILTFQESGKNYYSPRIGIHNLKNYFRGSLDVYVGKATDEIFETKLTAQKWQVVFLNEEKDYDTLMLYLDLIWENMEELGTLVVEYARSNDIVAKAYADFCKRRGRATRILPTKFGVGILTR